MWGSNSSLNNGLGGHCTFSNGDGGDEDNSKERRVFERVSGDDSDGDGADGGRFQQWPGNTVGVADGGDGRRHGAGAGRASDHDGGNGHVDWFALY